MSRPAPEPGDGLARRPTTADRWINRAAATTVVGLAGIAGALSYSHMRQLAQDHGQAGWHAHAFPLSVDGIEIVASLVLLADRQSGWLPWIALAAGAAGSLAANIATAHPDTVSRIIAGWPALALVLAVKLLSGILEHPAARDAHAPLDDQAKPASDAASPTSSFPGMTPPDPGELPAETHPARIETGPSDSESQQPPSSYAAPGPALDSREAALLPAARAARDELHQDGLPLTRDALAARLRQQGHPIRNASVTPLLRHLRHEQPTQPAA